MGRKGRRPQDSSLWTCVNDSVRVWDGFQNSPQGCDKLILGHTDSLAKLIHLPLSTDFRALLAAYS